MEDVSGIPGAVPALPAYPPESIRSHVPPEQWQACLDTWLFSIEYRLRLKQQHFSQFKLSQNAAGVPFLISYFHGYERRVEPIKSGSNEAKLHHQCYFLLKRLLLVASAPFDCSSPVLFDLLSGGSIAFHAISDWKVTLKQVWKRNSAQVKNAVDACKSSVVRNSPSNPVVVSTNLRRLKMLVRCLPELAMTAVVGVDYLEALMETYRSSSHDVQTEVTETTYHCLRALMSDGQKHTTSLLDTLFEMKSAVDSAHAKHSKEPNLLSSLVCVTPFLRHLKSDDEVANGKRGQGLIDTLSTYKQHTAHLHPLPTNIRRKQKGKQKVNPTEELHMHKASKISQIHDLFPDLSNTYVLRLLDHFTDDVEAVIAALLEPETLPANLQDQSIGNDADLPLFNDQPDLAPRSTPPLLPQRRNVFDNDDFDRLQISSSRLHRGRKEISNETQTADQLTRSKAAIMAALAAFDSDDDERDDTYDIADVGASVDNTLDSDERRGQGSDKNEETLYRAWKDNPELFARDSRTRIATARQQLKGETGMADEQIEGWAIMITRDPKMADRLQAKYSARAFRGQQHILERTSWGATASPSDSQDEGNVSSDGRRVGQAGIRGARQWNRGRGRGGDTAVTATAGRADSKETQLARKRKEQGRGRGGAAHNRREGRAKKIGRGMGPVANP